MHIRKQNIQDTEKLLQAINASFADYIVPFQLTAEQLQFKIDSESICLDWSAGVFDEGQLIAFIMHGVRNFDGKTVAYNAGTGVLPTFRGQGWVSKMYTFVEPFLKENQVQEMVLEVIESNLPAIRAYEKNGFSIQRKLLCFSGTVTQLTPASISIRNLETVSWKDLQLFWDIQPSWQSDVRSMDIVKPNILGAYIDNKLVGYAMFNTSTSRIYQLAVAPEHRRKGIASQLFTEISQQMISGKMQMNNIDEASESLKMFLEKQGLTNTINQFEMLKKL